MSLKSEGKRAFKDVRMWKGVSRKGYPGREARREWQGNLESTAMSRGQKMEQCD